MWRERAANGPYKSAGDVSENSPGDWNRIVRNTDRFLADPSAVRYTPDLPSGCAPRDFPRPRLEHDGGATLLRDAAFYSLVTGDTDAREAVAEELLAQADEDSTDFSDRDQYCQYELWDGAVFTVAHWMNKLLFAYDYVGRDAFTEAEQEKLDSWFYEAANFFAKDINGNAEGGLAQVFPDRWDGDHSIRSWIKENPSCDRYNDTYNGGDDTCKIARYYNNRRSSIARFVGIAGIYLDTHGFSADHDLSVDEIKRTAKLFAKEFLAYGVYPEGAQGDFHRATEQLPDKGWSYSAVVTGDMVTLADHFARAGDTSLYDYQTSDGAQGTAGEISDGYDSGPKTLRFVARSQARYVTGAYDRHIKGGRIDGEHGSWKGLTDITFAHGNAYWDDDLLSDLAHRDGRGLSGYPEDPAITVGTEVPWTGVGGIYPGVLFQFIDMPETTDPYNP